MKHRLSIVGIFIILSLTGFCQQKVRFTGYVKNAVFPHDPISTASIQVKGTDIAPDNILPSDGSGFFVIRFPTKDVNKDFVLKITHPEFESKSYTPIVISTLQPSTYYLNPIKKTFKKPLSDGPKASKPSIKKVPPITQKKETEEIDISELRKKYDLVIEFSPGIYRVKNNDLWGLTDYTGKILVPVKYKTIDKLQDGCAMFSIERARPSYPRPITLLGTMDKRGNILIEPKYSYLRKVCTIYAAIEYEEGYSTLEFISSDGDKLGNTRNKLLKGLDDCCNSLIPVTDSYSDPTWGAINEKGEFVYECKYSKETLLQLIKCK